ELLHYRAGKGAVIFLDLTLPVMDGYQVLEHIREEGLDAFVIVVSADIQVGAVDRVKASGAIGFVAKPVSTERIVPILKGYG
ncbi:response regulator, partial [Burkholderia pseudomallei]